MERLCLTRSCVRPLDVRHSYVHTMARIAKASDEKKCLVNGWAGANKKMHMTKSALRSFRHNCPP